MTQPINISFDKTNPRAVAYAHSHAAELVTGVDAATRDGIRAAIEEAFTSGVSPAVAARTIRDSVGLTEQGARVVASYRDELLAEGVPADEAEQQVGDYADELLSDRALMIVRTETMAAANAGQDELWNQAVESGELPGDGSIVKQWIAEDDACPECAAYADTTVPLGEEFEEGDPPLHPYCRCTMGLTEADVPVASDDEAQ